jgi:beta-mannosidase
MNYTTGFLNIIWTKVNKMKPAEKIKSLNGKWNYIPDRNNKLTYNQAARLFLRKKTKTIINPVNWELAGLHNFSGSIWYSRLFKTNNVLPGLCILEFKGVDYFADVWLNGSFIGHHEGYFQKFYFDISGYLESKNNNFLIVKVNSPEEEPGKVWPYKKGLIKGIFNHHDCRPGGWSLKHGQDQNTGGIWNDVNLYSLKNVYIENIRITTEIKKEKNALINVTVDYYSNASKSLSDEPVFEIFSPSGKKILKKHKYTIQPGRSSAKFNFEINNPQLWWSYDLGKPNLYLLKINSSEFSCPAFKFGIRKAVINKKQEFYLNDKRLFLRGTNVIPEQFLSKLKSNKIEQQIRLLKDANVNIIRVHAHINREEYYNECDKQGILVWQDFALQWTYDDSEAFVKNASSQIKDMVRQNYNHPSIVFWCCHNEPGEQIKTIDLSLKKALISIDKSRIVRLASNYEEHPYDGWYWGKKEHFNARPMGPLVTEFGAQAIPEISTLRKFIPAEQLYPPDREKWEYHNFQYDQTFNIAEVEKGKSLKDLIRNSQLYQAGLIKTAIDFYRQGKWENITGIFHFMFIDCWPSITWSIVDYYGKKKKGYYALQQAFQPVYVSVNVLQKKYFPGKQLNLEMWVINDLHISFKNCFIIFRINKNSFFKLKAGHVGEDSITRFKRESIKIKLPGTLKSGKHIITTELITGTRLLATNSFEIEIVRKDF